MSEIKLELVGKAYALEDSSVYVIEVDTILTQHQRQSIADSLPAVLKDKDIQFIILDNGMKIGSYECANCSKKVTEPVATIKNHIALDWIKHNKNGGITFIGGKPLVKK